MIARDGRNGQSESGVWSFTTGNEPPTAVITADKSDAIISYTANLTDASISTDDAIVSREWDFSMTAR